MVFFAAMSAATASAFLSRLDRLCQRASAGSQREKTRGQRGNSARMIKGGSREGRYDGSVFYVFSAASIVGAHTKAPQTVTLVPSASVCGARVREETKVPSTRRAASSETSCTLGSTCSSCGRATCLALRRCGLLSGLGLGGTARGSAGHTQHSEFAILHDYSRSVSSVGVGVALK